MTDDTETPAEPRQVPQEIAPDVELLLAVFRRWGGDAEITVERFMGAVQHIVTWGVDWHDAATVAQSNGHGPVSVVQGPNRETRRAGAKAK